MNSTNSISQPSGAIILKSDQDKTPSIPAVFPIVTPGEVSVQMTEREITLTSNDEDDSSDFYWSILLITAFTVTVFFLMKYTMARQSSNERNDFHSLDLDGL